MMRSLGWDLGGGQCGLRMGELVMGVARDLGHDQIGGHGSMRLSQYRFGYRVPRLVRFVAVISATPPFPLVAMYDRDLVGERYKRGCRLRTVDNGASRVIGSLGCGCGWWCGRTKASSKGGMCCEGETRQSSSRKRCNGLGMRWDFENAVVQRRTL